MYATHIFDGLEGWLTHLVFVSDGKLLKGMPVLEEASNTFGYSCAREMLLHAACHNCG